MAFISLRACSAAALAVVALCAASAAAAQTPTAPPNQTRGDAQKGLARADADFMKQAAQNGHAEIEGSKLAAAHSSNAEVKRFAQQMIDDHGKASQELSALASSKGVELPTEPSILQRGKLKLLSTDKGADFDRSYADDLGVEAHEDTVKLFRKAAANARDADVKAFASKTLPTLEHHLEMAKQLKSQTGQRKP